MNKSKMLKKLLSFGETLVMSDAYDSISAKLIGNAGFNAIQCSGYSFFIAAGYKRETDVTLNENVELTRNIVKSVDIPVMADAEDGYGDAGAVKDTVRKFIEAGVAGLSIEDQILDKEDRRKGTRIIKSEKMVEKIIAAREVAEAEGFSDL